MKTLLLWDIDGTLIASGGAGFRAFTTTLRDVFGIDESIADINFAGRTDPWIVREVFRKFGIPPTQQNFARFVAGYLTALPATLANANARVLPGVRDLLHALGARHDVAQGLLTGNIRRGAELKLSHHGLWHHFPFGAFGDDSELRDELGPHALRRAREHHGRDFAACDAWIIGDTPHDIACGKCVGARTLAVATGGFTVEQLQACEPTAVMEHLGDVDRVLDLLR